MYWNRTTVIISKITKPQHIFPIQYIENQHSTRHFFRSIDSAKEQERERKKKLERHLILRALSVFHPLD
jgi:hypothetical protein